MHLLLHITGIDGQPSNWSSYWQGIGNGTFIYFAGLLPMYLSWYRKNECHSKGCHRLGHHPYQHFHYCRKHHPKYQTKEKD